MEQALALQLAVKAQDASKEADQHLRVEHRANQPPAHPKQRTESIGRKPRTLLERTVEESDSDGTS
jgi:hypothetical protein